MRKAGINPAFLIISFEQLFATSYALSFKIPLQILATNAGPS